MMASLLYKGGNGSESCCHQAEEANVANKIRGRGNIVKIWPIRLEEGAIL